MDSDSQNEEEQITIFKKRGDKQIALSKTAQKNAAQITDNFRLQVEINGQIDPHNNAKSSSPIIHTSQLNFQHFFVKNKFRQLRSETFEAIREILNNKNIPYRTISDKEEQQVMVVRVIQKIDNALNEFIIQDENCQARLFVKEGIVWIGMLTAVKARWIDGRYQLDHVIDLSTPINTTQFRIMADFECYRILFLKGSLRPKFSHQDQGIKIISNELKKLRKHNITVNCIVLMGPVLSKFNKEVENCTLEKTFDEEYGTIIEQLRLQVKQINPNIQIFVLPSVDDVTCMHPIPQPSYEPENKLQGVKYLSNPCDIKIEGRRSQCNLNLINYDILKYIDTFKGGKAMKDLRRQNLETYLKQPFLMNNTLPGDPFDEINMKALFNKGNYGDLVIFSSQNSPPFINSINGRIVVNIGSLGVDYHYSGNHYMVLASIFEGEGPASQRTKIETISCV